MKYKILIIIGISVIALVAMMLVVFFVLPNHETPSNNQTKKSTSYQIDKGTELYAKIVKSAVEAYANQSISEPLASRKTRLSKYFLPGSSVFTKDLDISANNSVTRTEANANSIKFCTTFDTSYPCFIVTTELTSYYGDSSNVTANSYWITVDKDSSDSYLANDIGIAEE